MHGAWLRPRRLWVMLGVLKLPPLRETWRLGCLTKRGSASLALLGASWKPALGLSTEGHGRLGPLLPSALPFVRVLRGMALLPLAGWRPCCCASAIWNRSLGCGL